MNEYELMFPFVALILFIYGWSIPKLLRGLRESVLWKEETVNVTKFVRDELPYFNYHLGGKDLTSDRLPDDISDGAPVTFIYPQGAPEKAKLKYLKEDWPFSLALFVFASLASLMITLMFVEYAADKKEIASIRALKTTGVKITVPASSVSLEERYEGGELYTLIVTWIDPATGDALIFRGRTYDYDPSKQLAEKEQLDVYYDPTNNHRYLIDISLKGPITDVSDRPPVEDNPVKKGWVFFLFGTVLGAGSFFMLHHEYQLATGGERTIAKVLNFVTRRSKRGRYADYPFIQFSTSSGLRIRTVLQGGRSPSPYEVGDQLVIFYRPDEPEEVTALSHTSVIFASVMMFIGAAMMMAGVYFFLV